MASAHDQTLGRAFDGQAAAFELAPIQTDPALLAGLVAITALPAGAHVLDAGCGPGLLAAAFLDDPRGYRMTGCDLSAEMVARARRRCAPFGDRCTFVKESLAALAGAVRSGALPMFDAAVTRLTLHHSPDPARFVRDMVGATRAGGSVLLCDHLADDDPALADWHRRVESMRDSSHVCNLSARALVALATAAGLVDIHYEECAIATEFDEWFDRGTPSAPKEACRAALLGDEGRRSRAWRVSPLDDGGIRLDGSVGIARGVVPG